MNTRAYVLLASLGRHLPPTARALLEEALYAARECEHPLHAQLRDIARLRFGAGRLGVTDYYDYRLYDARSCEFDQRHTFAGWRMVATLDKHLNASTWHGLINDKLNAYLILHALGLPYPAVVGVVGARRAFLPGTPTVSDPDALHELLERGPLPLFAKPVHGSFGRDAFRIDAYDARTRMLQRHDAKSVPLAELLSLAANGRGYLLQTVVRQAPELDGVCGGRLSTIRASVVLEPDGPWLCHATWKITVGDNLTDNIDYGATGNLVAHVCVHTGKVLRVIGGAGRTLRTHTVHPDTGRALVDLQLPHWRQLRTELLRGASALPRLRFQHWDIALAESGPQVLEINNNGDLYLAQQAERRGYLEPRLLRALDEHEQ